MEDKEKENRIKKSTQVPGVGHYMKSRASFGNLES